MFENLVTLNSLTVVSKQHSSGIFVTILLCSYVLHCLVSEFINFKPKQLFGGMFVDVMKVSS